MRRHFEDIGHDEAQLDTTYENAQARERTQVLMDLANKLDGIVIGTGDLSELALGWATYNADHMSMYGVNASVPKALIRHLVAYAADSARATRELRDALRDVLDTPVSPERFLPPTDGAISQTEDGIVGPYARCATFLITWCAGWRRRARYTARVRGLSRRVRRGRHREVAAGVPEALFPEPGLKRSCMPDGPKVGSVSSPQGGLAHAQRRRKRPVVGQFAIIAHKLPIRACKEVVSGYMMNECFWFRCRMRRRFYLVKKTLVLMMVLALWSSRWLAARLPRSSTTATPAATEAPVAEPEAPAAEGTRDRSARC